MAIKDLLVHLDDMRGQEMRLAIACELAQRSDAHLTGIFIIEPAGLAPLAAPAGADFAQVEVLDMIQEKHRAARLAVANGLRESFRGAADRAGLAHEWRIVEGDPAELVALHARYADLAVLGQTDPDFPAYGAAVPEAVLLGSGRPLLTIPYVGRWDTVARRVLVAWNGTREAARAVNDALPILERAEAVTVLSINPALGVAGDGDVPAADIALHLARHGVKAEAAHTVAEDIAVGEILLSRAADFGSDLIVMGGYGHSRLREFALGGVTRTLLRHMTVPVLLSH